MDEDRLLEIVHELGREIQKDERYLKLSSTKAIMDADKEIQDLIGDFNLARMNLSAKMAEKEQKDEDSQVISALNKQVNEMYDRLMQHPLMVAYSAARDEMNNFMTVVNAILNAAVNGQNPDEVTEESCTGDCSTCGGCH